MALALLIIPTMMLANSSVDSAHTLTVKLEQGSLQVPEPPDSVADWPLVGEKVHSIWNGASNNLTGTLRQYDSEVKKVGKWALSAVAGAGATLLQFLLAILIGAIGGMMLSGIIGLFVGAVVPALSYRLFIAWLDRDFGDVEPDPTPIRE